MKLFVESINTFHPVALALGVGFRYPTNRMATRWEMSNWSESSVSASLLLALAAASSVTRCNEVANSRLISCQNLNKERRSPKAPLSVE
jgi:hypothetical protein